MMEDELKGIHEREDYFNSKVLEFTKQLTALETTTTHLIDALNKNEISSQARLQGLENSLTNVINTALTPVGERMTDISKIVRHHEELFDRLTRIQESQGTQIATIQETLKEFNEIQKKTADQEARIKALEDKQRSDAELKKEQTKGKWGFAVAVVSGILSALAVVLAAVIPAVVH